MQAVVDIFYGSHFHITAIYICICFVLILIAARDPKYSFDYAVVFMQSLLITLLLSVQGINTLQNSV